MATCLGSTVFQMVVVSLTPVQGHPRVNRSCTFITVCLWIAKSGYVQLAPNVHYLSSSPKLASTFGLETTVATNIQRNTSPAIQPRFSFGTLVSTILRGMISRIRLIMFWRSRSRRAWVMLGLVRAVRRRLRHWAFTPNWIKRWMSLWHLHLQCPLQGCRRR